VQGISVRLAHASPGRIRLKVEDFKHDPVKARDIEAKLRTVPGIRSADANPLTGSLLLTYDDPALGSMELPFAVAQVLGISLNDLDPADLRLLMSHQGNGNKLTSSSISEGLESTFKDMNAAVRRTVGADLAVLLPLALAGLGVRSLLVSEKPLVPSWHDYLWFSFSTYFMLNRTNPPQ
jgi:Heavy metal associated domain 2